MPFVDATEREEDVKEGSLLEVGLGRLVEHVSNEGRRPEVDAVVVDGDLGVARVVAADLRRVAAVEALRGPKVPGRGCRGGVSGGGRW